MYISIPTATALMEQNQYGGSKPLFQNTCKITESFQNREDFNFQEER